MTTTKTRRGGENRGFASMNPELQRQIASKGGKAAHEKGTAHEFSSEEARIAGRKGGMASHGGGRSKSVAKKGMVLPPEAVSSSFQEMPAP